MKLLFKHIALIMVLVCFAGFANQSDSAEKSSSEQKAFRLTEHCSLSVSLIEGKSHRDRFFSFLDQPFIPDSPAPSADCDFVHRLFTKRWNDLSYKGKKIQTLSACSHPPTLFIA